MGCSEDPPPVENRAATSGLGIVILKPKKYIKLVVFSIYETFSIILYLLYECLPGYLSGLLNFKSSDDSGGETQLGEAPSIRAVAALFGENRVQARDQGSRE